MEHELVDIARKYVGVKYWFKGRSRGGLDCAGVAILSIREYTIPDYEYLEYSANPNPTHIKRELLKIADKVDSMQSGDIFLIRLHGAPQHVAIYTNNNTIIHAYEDIGKVVEEKYTKYWQNKLDSIYRLRN